MRSELPAPHAVRSKAEAGAAAGSVGRRRLACMRIQSGTPYPGAGSRTCTRPRPPLRADFAAPETQQSRAAQLGPVHVTSYLRPAGRRSGRRAGMRRPMATAPPYTAPSRTGTYDELHPKFTCWTASANLEWIQLPDATRDDRKFELVPLEM
jgi:hypothetical protein